jgi:hypothetical protein
MQVGRSVAVAREQQASEWLLHSCAAPPVPVDTYVSTGLFDDRTFRVGSES